MKMARIPTRVDRGILADKGAWSIDGVTFDDGYRSKDNAGFPNLLKYRLRAIFFHDQADSHPDLWGEKISSVKSECRDYLPDPTASFIVLFMK